MKVLVVLSAIVACALAEPGVIGYSAAVPAATAILPGSVAAHAPVAYAAPASVAAHAPVAYAAPASVAAHAPVAYAAQASVAAHAPVAYAAPAAVAAHAPVAYAAPAAHAPVAYAAPAVVAAPAVPAVAKSQYHAQDELGQARYGHTEPFQAHHAVRDAHGNVAGSYAYINPVGQEIRVDYTAGHGGFRAVSNAIPVGPLAVHDTPEVVAARSAHLTAVAHARGKRSPGVLVGAPVQYHAAAVAAPVQYHAAAVAAPVAVPAARSALLTTIVNTPGHAVSYRVD